MWNDAREKRYLLAQALSEYVIMIGLVAAALAGMQAYMKRAIQAVVKVSADELGEQRKGGLEYDFRFDWKIRGDKTINSTASETTTVTKADEGQVSYTSDKRTTQGGIDSNVWWTEKE